jgi:hypothetical protein
MKLLLNNHFLMDYIIRFNFYDINEYLDLRLVCNDFNKAINLFIRKKYNSEDNVYFRRTLFNTTMCMACQKTCNKDKMKAIYYYYDCHPSRITMYCNNYNCYIKTLRTWANSSFINNNVIFLKKKLNSPDKLWIPRSDGSKTLSSLEKRYLILFENQILFHFSFFIKRDNFVKICSIEDILKLNSENLEQILDLSNQINENNIVPFYDYQNHRKIVSLLPIYKN